MNEWKSVPVEITDLLPIGICRIDSRFVITVWNKTLERWTGIKATKVIGSNLFSVFPDLDTHLMRTRFSDVLKNGIPQVLSSRFNSRFFPVDDSRGHESKYQKTTLLPDIGKDRDPGIVITIEDVTGLTGQVIAYRQMKDTAFSEIEERKKAQEALARSNHLVNLYLDIITHDINTLISSALDYNLILLNELPDTSYENATRLHETLKRSIRVIQNISTIRKIEHEVPELYPIDIDSIIRSEISYFDSANIHYTGTSDEIYADELFSELVANIIENSIKHGSPDCEIWIKVIKVEDLMEIRFEDNGPGVDEELKHVLFDRVRRGIPKNQEKGLGLYIVKMLVERYGGIISASDRIPGRKDEGLAIILTFPLRH